MGSGVWSHSLSLSFSDATLGTTIAPSEPKQLPPQKTSLDLCQKSQLQLRQIFLGQLVPCHNNKCALGLDSGIFWISSTLGLVNKNVGNSSAHSLVATNTNTSSMWALQLIRVKRSSSACRSSRHVRIHSLLARSTCWVLHYLCDTPSIAIEPLLRLWI